MQNDKRNALDTPSVIRGESPTGEILIDTFSVTFSKSAFFAVSSSIASWNETDKDLHAGFQRFLNYVFGPVFELQEGLKSGRNGFDHRFEFEQGAGFVSFGGNNKVFKPSGIEYVEERLQIMVTGEGCALVKSWDRAHKSLSTLQRMGFDVRLTRVDIACDFHSGDMTVDDAEHLYDEGFFTSRGRPPACRKIDDKGTGAGCTFYVGKRENGKLFRAYEKGKQLGDKSSPWVRYEVELRNKDREIPLDILLTPADFIAGSYPALSFISKIQAVIKTGREKARITYTTMRYWAKRQYGKLLNYAHTGLGYTMEQVFYEFFNEAGYPDRLPIPKGV